MSFDVYSVVTDRIIQQLESGIIPWQKPWTGLQSGAYSGTLSKVFKIKQRRKVYLGILLNYAKRGSLSSLWSRYRIRLPRLPSF